MVKRDTVVFNVTTTGTTPGNERIYGDVDGIEINRNVAVHDDASDSGHGSILLQGLANLAILLVTPSPSTLTSDALLPWDITVVVRNNGESAARLVLPAGVSVTVSGTSPPATFDPVNFLEEGGVVLDGGETGTLVVHGDAAPHFTAFDTRDITVSLTANELNSNRPLNPSAIGNVLAQKAPVLTVALVPNPTVMTQGGQAFLQADITNGDANAATVNLDPGNTRVSFAGGAYSAVMQLVSPTQILANQTVRVSFENKLVDPSIPAGFHNVAVDLAYTSNSVHTTDPTRTVTNGVNVLAPPSFRITRIDASQPTVTRGADDALDRDHDHRQRGLVTDRLKPRIEQDLSAVCRAGRALTMATPSRSRLRWRVVARNSELVQRTSSCSRLHRLVSRLASL